MCGIAGIIGDNLPQSARERVAELVTELRHRGPDGEGIESWPNAVLGHRRLAIFDLSDAGRQPMLSADRNVGVVFNGAIYNFTELRSRLEGLGHQFRSRTDTEVLIEGYRAWGLPRLLQELRGMFALCLWDDQLQTAWLVRDRLGVKPLFYAQSRGKLAFASTARALRRAGFGSEISAPAIASALEFGFVPDSQCIFEGLSKLQPGCYLKWSRADGAEARIEISEYWKQPVAAATRMSFEDAVEETERLLLQAVARRLQADVPVAALLSGGIDSALVCWAIGRLGASVQAFTVGTPGLLEDETGAAAATAARLGIPHRILPMDAAAAPDVSELAAAYCEPFPCSSAFGMLGISAAVRREATVMLTGDGGDDVFLGYSAHRLFWLAEYFGKLLPDSVAERWTASRSRDSDVRGPALTRAAQAARFLDYASGGKGAIDSAHDTRAFYSRSRLAGERLRAADVWLPQSAWSASRRKTLLQDYLDDTLHHRFSGEYLTKVDGATMWHALEARSPFLDQDLWEFGASLHPDVRLHRGKLKAVLRELARRHIGESVSKAPKRGFSIPAERWLVTAWRDEFESSIGDSRLVRQGFLDAEALRSLWQTTKIRSIAPRQLWYVHAVETWLRFEESSAGSGARHS